MTGCAWSCGNGTGAQKVTAYLSAGFLRANGFFRVNFDEQ